MSYNLHWNSPASNYQILHHFLVLFLSKIWVLRFLPLNLLRILWRLFEFCVVDRSDWFETTSLKKREALDAFWKLIWWGSQPPTVTDSEIIVKMKRSSGFECLQLWAGRSLIIFILLQIAVFQRRSSNFMNNKLQLSLDCKLNLGKRAGMTHLRPFPKMILLLKIMNFGFEMCFYG